MNRSKIITDPKLVKAVESFRVALDYALHWMFFSPHKRKGGKPGEIIKRMNPEQRESLKHLTSDLIRDVKKEFLYSEKYEKKKKLSKIKEKIDKTFKKRI